MTIREQLSADQWKVIFNAPFAAAAYAATASGGSFELVKEMFAASRFMTETVRGEVQADYGPLVTELLQEMKGLSRDEARDLSPNYQAQNPEDLRTQVRKAIQEAAQLVKTLPGADGFQRWLLDTARSAVEASRGGFLGIGANKEPVDEQEQQALNEIRLLLNF